MSCAAWRCAPFALLGCLLLVLACREGNTKPEPAPTNTLQWHSFAREDPDEFYGVAFSSDGQYVAAGGQVIRVYQLDTGQELPLLSAVRSGGDYRTLAFVPGGTALLTSGLGRAHLWDPVRDLPVRTFTIGNRLERRMGAAVVVCPRGELVAASFQGGMIGIWEIATGAVRTSLQHGSEKGPWIRGPSLACSKDGTRLVSVADDGRAVVWDSSSGTVLADFTVNGQPLHVIFAPDDRHVIISLVKQGTTEWDIAGRRRLRVLDAKGKSAFLFPDRERIAIFEDQHLRIRRLNSGRLLSEHTVDVHGFGLGHALSNDGTLAATAGVSVTSGRSGRVVVLRL